MSYDVIAMWKKAETSKKNWAKGIRPTKIGRRTIVRKSTVCKKKQVQVGLEPQAFAVSSRCVNSTSHASVG